MARRFVVIGLGNFGATVARSLHAAGHEVLAVDMRGDVVDHIAPHTSRAVVADGRSAPTLERAGVRGADAGVVSTGDDITASILAMIALHDLGVRQVYVKVISEEHARVMSKLGATETIFPERDSGHRLAVRVGSVALLNYFRLGAGFSIHEMAVPDTWLGRSLRELALPERHRISVIGRHDMLTDETVAIVDPDRPLTDSDTLLVAGRDEDLARVSRAR
jgi:trk system potassium uptake protein TrkA